LPKLEAVNDAELIGPIANAAHSSAAIRRLIIG
jgi:hypothetical protein